MRLKDFGSPKLFKICSILLMFVLVTIAPTASLVYADTQTEYESIIRDFPYYDDTVCESSKDPLKDSGGSTVVVIDPGHSGREIKEKAPGSNLETYDYPSATSEMDDVFGVAVKLEEKLKKDGYTVIKTKDKTDSTVGLVTRADIANKNKADIAISIHTDSSTFGKFGSSGWVTPQEVGKYRGTSKEKITFEEKEIAKKSLEYSKNIMDARNKSGENNVTIHDLNFDGRGGNIVPGNIAWVQLLSKSPWVYNEAGGPLNTEALKENYAQGLYDGITSSVGPKDHSETSGRGDDDSGTDTTESSDLDKLGDANKGYNGEKIWNSSQLKKIKQNQPFYEKAAEKEGIPWQLIPPVHLRESGLGRSNPDNGQGIYQDYERYAGPYPPGPVSDQEFQRQTDWVAKVLRLKAKGNPAGLQSLKGEPKADAIKETYFGYNGRHDDYYDQARRLGFKLGSDGSPYVMNQADKIRDPEENPTGWGQVKSDGGSLEFPANAGWGAYIMYAALSGVGSDSTAGTKNCQSSKDKDSELSGTCAEKIVQVAEAEYKKYGGRPIEGSAIQKKYSDGVVELWCADFVSWVLKEAGSPFKGGVSGGWRIPSVDGVKAYFQKHGEYHASGSGYKPRLGDIVIYDQGGLSHVNIIVEIKGNSHTTIGGNESDGIGKSTDYELDKITGYGTMKCD